MCFKKNSDSKNWSDLPQGRRENLEKLPLLKDEIYGSNKAMWPTLDGSQNWDLPSSKLIWLAGKWAELEDAAPIEDGHEGISRGLRDQN